MDHAKLGELARFYRKHLLDDVMPFWECRTKDHECGGYLTCFDRQGKLTDPDKYIWFQGRQLWMFSALYNRVEKRDLWLDLARQGRDFLVRHAYAGNGRWHYQLDRTGKQAKQSTISIYTDHFVLSGLCEYALASGSDQDRDLIDQTYQVMEKNIYDPEFKDIFHGTWSPKYKRHGLCMISVHVAEIASQILGQERTRTLIDHCLQEILYVFTRDDRRLLFESVGQDGSIVMEPEGQLINPGHALEAMCFCLPVGLERGDQAIIDRCLAIAEWMYEVGYDNDYGGIVAFLDARGTEPAQLDWHKETDAMWHDKVWWVHCEALYAAALCALLTDSPVWFDRFLDLHDWCQQHFYDPEYGEWYAALYRDGTPKLTDKGTVWKAAYHLPRCLMMIMKLFETGLPSSSAGTVR